MVEILPDMAISWSGVMSGRRSRLGPTTMARLGLAILLTSANCATTLRKMASWSNRSLFAVGSSSMACATESTVGLAESLRKTGLSSYVMSGSGSCLRYSLTSAATAMGSCVMASRFTSSFPQLKAATRASTSDVAPDSLNTPVSWHAA